MYQTLFIDVDEEVNSVINRIKKSNSKYNILVIAPGALLMQSSVSLKLIKREVDYLEKKVMIVTKDEMAANIARKSGFPVKNSLEEIKELNNNISLEKKSTILPPKKILENSNSADPLNKRSRLVNLGSDSFISTNQSIIEKSDPKIERNVFSGTPSQVGKMEKFKEDINERNDFFESEKDEFGDLFSEDLTNVEKTENKAVRSPKTSLKFIWFFVSIIVLLIMGVAAYFYLPSAEVTVFPQKKNENFSLNLVVSENMTEDSGNISENSINLGANIIEKENILSLDFEATGSKGDSNQKAKGKITIYNEFSETSQVLVATTRFLSNDNKLFRLLETVTVPGATVVNGKTEPGKIEASIVADEPGADFNIKEATFNIPGFKGSPKYDKFYAKLNEETKGGGDSGGELRIVSGTDIANARFKAESQLKNQLKDELKSRLREGDLLLENATAYEVLDFSVFPEEGSVTENFEYQIKMKIKAIYFSEKDLDSRVADFMEKSHLKQSMTMELVSFEKNFGNADIDFDKKTIKTNLSINAKMRTKIDAEKISSSLAGKNKNEVEEIISRYPEVNKIEASISPNFIANSFPKYPSKIKININKD